MHSEHLMWMEMAKLRSELKALLESTGQTGITDGKIKEMMESADKNKDGYLDFEEFMQMILEE